MRLRAFILLGPRDICAQLVSRTQRPVRVAQHSPCQQNHIGLFLLASRQDGALRSSVLGLALSTAVGVGLLLGAGFAHGGRR